MEITQSGKAKFSCQGSEFVLNDVLVVSYANKNLVSVKNFCKDNYVFVEFDEQKSKVIDRDTKKILVEDEEEEGFYLISLLIKHSPQVSIKLFQVAMRSCDVHDRMAA